MTRRPAATWCSGSTGPATTPGRRSPRNSPGSARSGRTEVVPTLTPIPQADGELIADIDDDGVTRHVVAFGLVQGREPAEGEDMARWFRELGAINARLHAHAKGWQRPDGVRAQGLGLRRHARRRPALGRLARWARPDPGGQGGAGAHRARAARSGSRPMARASSASAWCMPTCASPICWSMATRSR